jgi:hypothetical protein
LVLGAALDSNLSLAAGDGLVHYFLPSAVKGGTEEQMYAAREWFKSNKARLQKEALAKQKAEQAADGKTPESTQSHH